MRNLWHGVTRSGSVVRSIFRPKLLKKVFPRVFLESLCGGKKGTIRNVAIMNGRKKKVKILTSM